jgi:phosphate transport system ATP-binding protein
MKRSLRCQGLTVSYGDMVIVRDVSLTFEQQSICSVIGPPGAGKSTLLQALNRMIDLEHNSRVEGAVELGQTDIYAPGVDPAAVRRQIAMVFNRPATFPQSIWHNIIWALKINRLAVDADAVVESVLTKVGLWDELKDRLQQSALKLSPGQQQRLCVARCLALEPDVLVLDEPTASLDPIAAGRLEDVLLQLKQEYTIVLASHNVQQAGRIADYSAFLLDGDLVEYGPSSRLFFSPADKRTEDYLCGRLG